MDTLSEKKSGHLTDKEHRWFEDFISTIKTHELMLETKTAPKKIEDMYKVFFSGNQLELSKLSKNAADQVIIKKVILDYLQEIAKRSFPKKLSFDISDCHVLVWAEIAENDEKSEDNLILVEAKINNKYKNFGVDMSCTIIEDCDNVPAPANYSTVV